MKRFLSAILFLMMEASVALPQGASVTTDANGNVVNSKPTNFPTGKLLYNGQPPAQFPSETGNSGKVLSNTGAASTEYWATLASLFPNQSANFVFAGPSSGGAAAPGFRSLVANDIPALSALNGTLNWGQIAVPNVTNAIFVSQAYGNDSNSGSILGLPKLTIGGAKAAASSGQTIAILDGTFDERNLFKNGVNYFFFAGSGIASTSTNSSGIFDDWTTGSNGAVSCSISGFGTFSSADSHGVLFLRNASTINFQGKSLSAPNATTIFTRNATLHLHADSISSAATSGSAAVWWNSGECFIEADDITGPGPATVYSTAVFGEQPGKYFWVKAKKIYNTSSTISSLFKAVWFQDQDSAARSWVEAQEIKGPIAVSTQFGFGVNYIIKTGKIFGKIDHAGTGFLYLDTQKVSDDGLGSNLLSISGSGGSSWMNIGQFDDSGLTGVTAISVSNGTNYLAARSLTRGTTGDGVSVSGGSLTLSGVAISTQSGSNDLVQSGGTLKVLGVAYDPTKTSGTITIGDPLVALAQSQYQSITVSAAGNTNSNSTVNSHTAYLTANAGAGAYTATFSIPTSGRSAGDRESVHLHFAASSNPTVEVHNNTSGGTLLFTWTGDGTVTDILAECRFDGANWYVHDAHFVW